MTNHRVPWIWYAHKEPIYNEYPIVPIHRVNRGPSRFCPSATSPSCTSDRGHHLRTYIDRSGEETRDGEERIQDRVGSIAELDVLQTTGAQAGHSGEHAH